MTNEAIRQYKRSQFGHFNNIIYNPDWLFSARVNELIDKGVVKYYRSLTDFKNRKNEIKKHI